jgi:hypothetical protein
MEPATFPTYLKDYTGQNFELSKKTAKKIQYYHYIRDTIEVVKEVLENPDSVYKSNHKDDHHLYYQKDRKGGLYIVVVADVTQKRIDTAYKSNKIKEGELIWTNS